MPIIYNATGTQNTASTPHLPSRALNDLLQFCITAMIPLSYQDKDIYSFKMGRMKIIQGRALKERSQEQTAPP